MPKELMENLLLMILAPSESAQHLIKHWPGVFPQTGETAKEGEKKQSNPLWILGPGDGDPGRSIDPILGDCEVRQEGESYKCFGVNPLPPRSFNTLLWSLLCKYLFFGNLENTGNE